MITQPLQPKMQQRSACVSSSNINILCSGVQGKKRKARSAGKLQNLRMPSLEIPETLKQSIPASSVSRRIIRSILAGVLIILAGCAGFASQHPKHLEQPMHQLIASRGQINVESSLGLHDP